jgi:hypothetical protein
VKVVEKKAPPGWLAVPNKSMTYIDLAKLFNVDAVTYNIFIREFYPFGTGESLVVRTHKALRPTNIKQGTHVPDPTPPTSCGRSTSPSCRNRHWP